MLLFPGRLGLKRLAGVYRTINYQAGLDSGSEGYLGPCGVAWEKFHLGRPPIGTVSNFSWPFRWSWPASSEVTFQLRNHYLLAYLLPPERMAILIWKKHHVSDLLFLQPQWASRCCSRLGRCNERLDGRPGPEREDVPSASRG